MKITKDFEAEVVESYDEVEDCIDGSLTETFRVGEVFDVDVISKNEDSYFIQFGDGSVTSVPADSVEFDPEELEFVNEDQSWLWLGMVRLSA